MRRRVRSSTVATFWAVFPNIAFRIVIMGFKEKKRLFPNSGTLLFIQRCHELSSWQSTAKVSVLTFCRKLVGQSFEQGPPSHRDHFCLSYPTQDSFCLRFPQSPNALS